MPIPSPDATNNQVLDTINPEQDHIAIEPATKVNEIVSVIEPRILSKQQQQVRAADDNYVNVASVTRFHADIVNGKTISGGLTLDKKNKSLKNLIYYIRTAYSNNLTSPKWKNFKGLRLQVMEKIRLNNVIWRTWFEQCMFLFICLSFNVNSDCFYLNSNYVKHTVYLSFRVRYHDFSFITFHDRSAFTVNVK